MTSHRARARDRCNPGRHPPVSRTIAIREHQTLEQLHEALRLAFGWADPHLYSFWVGGDFWDHDVPHYTAPFEMDESDEWRLALKVVDAWPHDEMAYPMLVATEGTAPPQYVEHDDGD